MIYAFNCHCLIIATFTRTSYSNKLQVGWRGGKVQLTFFALDLSVNYDYEHTQKNSIHLPPLFISTAIDHGPIPSGFPQRRTY